jgi:hypothetical protein
MDTLQTMAISFGSSWVAGVNTYATVFTLGLLGWFGKVDLPEGLQVCSNPWVMGVAFALYSVEFVADKIPAVDSAWDAVQTFIRVPAGIAISYGGFEGYPEAVTIVAAMLGGTLALGSHATKTTTRLAINTSPEPFTNIGASLTEDAVAIGTVILAYVAPILALLLLVAMIAISAYVVPKMFRFARSVARRLLGRSSKEATATVQIVPDQSPTQSSRRT